MQSGLLYYCTQRGHYARIEIELTPAARLRRLGPGHTAQSCHAFARRRMPLPVRSGRMAHEGDGMVKTTPVQNKALVLQAFDTLFNKRDYEAAERYWSSNYIQHSAHTPPGRAPACSIWLGECQRR